jgi:imidazoleglycerol phosphate synthase glutamine amidotransferase subunit HisH
MRQIEPMGLRGFLDEAALSRRIPILGMCLGMQLMTRSSGEGQLPDMGWIKADTHLINDASKNLCVPHMGWNLVNIKNPAPILIWKIWGAGGKMHVSEYLGYMSGVKFELSDETSNLCRKQRGRH